MCRHPVEQTGDNEASLCTRQDGVHSVPGDRASQLMSIWPCPSGCSRKTSAASCFSAAPRSKSVQFSSVTVLADSLQPRGLQQDRLPCPSPTPGAYSNSCPLSWWCHPTISSPVIHFSSNLPSIRVFSNESVLCIRWPKYWTFSFSISPSNEYSGLISFTMDWLDRLQSKALSRVKNINSSALSFFIVQLSQPYLTTGKTIALTRQTFVGKVMSLLFSMLSRLVKAFLQRSKHLLISWLQSPSAVILEAQKIKSVTISIVFPSICHEVMGPDAVILVFWILHFKPTLSHSSFTFIKRLFSSSSLSAIRVKLSAYLRLLIFLLAIFFPVCVSSSPAFLMIYSA